MRMVDGVVFPYVGQSAARFSLDGTYRYELVRRWARGPVMTWVMLNPSTADGVQDDATIRRCVDYAKTWGMSGIIVVNLFAMRATNPHVLRYAHDPIGPDNDEAIHDAVVSSRLVMAAWGANGNLFGRDKVVIEMLEEIGRSPLCLGKTAGGHPKHPVRLSKSLMPVTLT